MKKSRSNGLIIEFLEQELGKALFSARWTDSRNSLITDYLFVFLGFFSPLALLMLREELDFRCFVESCLRSPPPAFFFPACLYVNDDYATEVSLINLRSTRDSFLCLIL